MWTGCFKNECVTYGDDFGVNSSAGASRAQDSSVFWPKRDIRKITPHGHVHHRAFVPAGRSLRRRGSRRRRLRTRRWRPRGQRKSCGRDWLPARKTAKGAHWGGGGERPGSRWGTGGRGGGPSNVLCSEPGTRDAGMQGPGTRDAACCRESGRTYGARMPAVQWLCWWAVLVVVGGWR